MLPPGILHPTWICPTGPSLYCLHGTWALTPIQMVTPLSWPHCIPTSIGSHHQSGLWGATPLEAKGWDAPSQSIEREPVGSLHQRFRSRTDGERGLLQDKPSTFQSWNLTWPDGCLPGHGHIYWPTRFPNLQDPGGLGRAEWAAIC